MTQPLRSAPPAPASSTQVALERLAQREEWMRGRQLWTLETWEAYLEANPVPEGEPGGDLWEAIQAGRRQAGEGRR